jgi:hypothetical protein
LCFLYGCGRLCTRFLFAKLVGFLIRWQSFTSNPVGFLLTAHWRLGL